ncbi:MAG TPA: FAD-dependent oxidoreductase [Candidatus Rubrimentiphilum sp.]|nr:FAD-dependent oxidoreductase [Candidatus Rubrimentiphilum sp.]
MKVKVAIAGGGPAGMVLGFLLARAGIEVAVLEKHADFLRDFRGDTIHPSTLDIIWELGLLDAFLALPHSQITQFSGVVNDKVFPFVDLSHVPTHCKFLAFMPQWDFLNFLAERGRRYPAFHVLLETEAVETLNDGAKVTGVRAKGPQGDFEIRADLTVGADGRHSTLRGSARLPAKDFGAPIDVLWLRLPREPSDPGQVFGYIKNGGIFVMLMRDTYWQCAYVIPKGSFETVKARGIDEFRSSVAQQAPFVAGRVGALQSWDDVKLLTVQVDRLERWYRDGLLFIGDAAHAMSPIGGVGINLAVQDAVAAANILYPALSAGSAPDLAAVQRRRIFPTVMTQSLQLLIQNTFMSRILHGANAEPIKPPLVLEAFRHFPLLRRVPALLIGVGFRPEHVHTPETM